MASEPELILEPDVVEKPSSATGKTSVVESRDLESLTKLMNDGVLDQQDYNLAKRRILEAQRDKLLEEAGVSEQDRSGWTWSSSQDAPTKLEAIEYKDLTQQVCASGMLAADHVIEVLKDGAMPMQAAQGCAGLSILAEKAGTRVEVMAKGAVDAVVAAMSGHADDALVQEKGCQALANCAVGEGEGETRAKGLVLVLAAMEAHRAARGVQFFGCRALANCAFSPEGEAEVVERGGVAAALAAMTAHAEDAGVQEEAADALGNVVGGEAGRAAALAADGVGVAEAARAAHPRCESVTDLLKALSA